MSKKYNVNERRKHSQPSHKSIMCQVPLFGVTFSPISGYMTHINQVFELFETFSLFFSFLDACIYISICIEVCFSFLFASGSHRIHALSRVTKLYFSQIRSTRCCVHILSLYIILSWGRDISLKIIQRNSMFVERSV